MDCCIPGLPVLHISWSLLDVYASDTKKNMMKIEKKHSTEFSNTHEALSKCAIFIMPSDRWTQDCKRRGWVWFMTVPLFSSLLFVGVQLLSRVRLFVTPWTAARQASLSITNSQSLLRLIVHQFSDAIQPPQPLSFPSLPTFNFSQHQGLF